MSHTPFTTRNEPAHNPAPHDPGAGVLIKECLARAADPLWNDPRALADALDTLVA